MNVAGVIEDHNFDTFDPIDSRKRLSPVGRAVIRRRSTGRDRKDIEVSRPRCYFVADHGRKIPPHAHLHGERIVVNVYVVVGRDRQFDPLTGQRDHPFLNGGVPVTGMRSRVNVSVAGDVAFGRNDSADCGRNEVFLSRIHLNFVFNRKKTKIGTTLVMDPPRFY